GRGDLADLRAKRIQELPSLCVVDRDLPVVDDVAAACGRDPLERVAGKALVRVALEDEAGEGRVRAPLAGLDLLGLREQVRPGLRRGAVVVLLQEVLTVVEDPVVA